MLKDYLDRLMAGTAPMILMVDGDGEGEGDDGAGADADGAGAAGDAKGSEGEAKAGDEDDKKAAPKSVEKLVARNNRLGVQLREQMDRNAELERRLAALEQPAPKKGDEDDGKPPEVSDREAVRREVQQEEAARRRMEQFNALSNKTHRDGKELYGDDFDSAMKQYLTLDGGLGALEAKNGFWSAALSTDSPADVLYTLANDLDRAEEISNMLPFRAAIEMNKVAEEVRIAREKAANEKVERKTSKAPDPVKPVKGGTTEADPTSAHAGLPIEDWMQRRNEAVKDSSHRRLRRTAI